MDIAKEEVTANDLISRLHVLRQEAEEILALALEPSPFLESRPEIVSWSRPSLRVLEGQGEAHDFRQPPLLRAVRDG